MIWVVLYVVVMLVTFWGALRFSIAVDGGLDGEVVTACAVFSVFPPLAWGILVYGYLTEVRGDGELDWTWLEKLVAPKRKG